MINTKGVELTPKLNVDMVSPPWKLLLKLTLTNSSLKSHGKDFGSLGAYQGIGMGRRNGRWDGLFTGKVCHQLSNRAMDVRQP